MSDQPFRILPTGQQRQAQQQQQAPELPEPFSLEAEEGVIGGILSYPDRFPEVLSILTAGAKDFRVDRHQVIFAAMQTLYLHDEVIDPVTVANKLGGEFTATWSELLALQQTTPVPGAILDYARVVANKARRRRDIILGRALINDAYLEPNDAAYTVTRAAFAEGVAFDHSPAESSQFKVHRWLDLLEEPQPQVLDAEMRLFEGQLGLIFAESNVGKSAYLLWRLCALADSGRNVVYITGEGQRGIARRVKAAVIAHGFDQQRVNAHLGIIRHAPQLLLLQEVDTVISQIGIAFENGDPIALIALDTLSTAIPGQNENDAAVMSAAAAGMRRIMEAFETTGVITHHSGKDKTRGERGNSSLRATVDISIELTREEDSNVVVAHGRKSRDDERDWTEAYSLHGQLLSESAHDTSVTLLTGATPPPALIPRLTDTDEKVSKALQSLDCGMRYGALVAEANRMFGVSEAAAKRSIATLKKCGYARVDEDGVYHYIPRQ